MDRVVIRARVLCAIDPLAHLLLDLCWGELSQSIRLKGSISHALSFMNE